MKNQSPNFINVIYLPDVWSSDSIDANTFSKIAPLKHTNYHSVVLIFGDQNIEPFFKILPPETKVIFWVHANLKKEGAEYKMRNEKYFYSLKTKTELPNLKIYFITADVLEEIIIGDKRKGDAYRFIKSSKDKTQPEILLYPQNALQDLSYFHNILLPDRQCVGDILTKYQAKLAFDFSYSSDPFFQQVFEESIDEEATKRILGAVLENRTYVSKSKPEITVLSSGLSGTFDIMVNYEVDEGIFGSIVIKIDANKSRLEKEIRNSLLAKENSRLDKNLFLFTHDKEVLTVGKWFILTYNSLLHLVPLSTKIDIETKELKKIISDVKAIFGNLESAIGNLDTLTTFSWNSDKRTSTNGMVLYRGLTFSKKIKINSLRELKSINQITKCKYLSSKYSRLKAFINHGKYLDERIDKQPTYVPIARVHGNFNSNNIFVTRTGITAKFIDFASVSKNPNDHALLDIGKLSIDLEFRIIKDNLFVLKADANNDFNYWLSKHRAFLYSTENIEGNPSLPPSNKGKKWIDKSYKINKFILAIVRSYAQKLKRNVNIPVEELEKSLFIQFIQVRLHYFIKMTTYTNILMEKRYFAFRAVLDILDFLHDQNNPSQYP